jgi:hypothetical protein
LYIISLGIPAVYRRSANLSIPLLHPRTRCLIVALCGLRAGSYSEGNDRAPCLPCPRGKTSSPGAWSEASCYAQNKCPSGAATPHDYSALVKALKSKDGAQATVGIASVGGSSSANATDGKARVNATTHATRFAKQRVYRTTPPEGHDDNAAKSAGGIKLGAGKVKIDPQVFEWKPLKQAPKQAPVPVMAEAPVGTENIPLRAENVPVSASPAKAESTPIKAVESKADDSYYYHEEVPQSDDYYAYKSYIDADTCVCKPG